MSLISKNRHALIIVDDFSRYTWMKFLETKDEAPKIVITHINIDKVSNNASVIALKSDNKTKF